MWVNLKSRYVNIFSYGWIQMPLDIILSNGGTSDDFKDSCDGKKVI